MEPRNLVKIHFFFLFSFLFFLWMSRCYITFTLLNITWRKSRKNVNLRDNHTSVLLWVLRMIFVHIVAQPTAALRCAQTPWPSFEQNSFIFLFLLCTLPLKAELSWNKWGEGATVNSREEGLHYILSGNITVISPYSTHHH